MSLGGHRCSDLSSPFLFCLEPTLSTNEWSPHSLHFDLAPPASQSAVPAAPQFCLNSLWVMLTLTFRSLPTPRLHTPQKPSLGPAWEEDSHQAFSSPAEVSQKSAPFGPGLSTWGPDDIVTQAHRHRQPRAIIREVQGPKGTLRRDTHQDLREGLLGSGQKRLLAEATPKLKPNLT